MKLVTISLIIASTVVAAKLINTDHIPVNVEFKEVEKTPKILAPPPTINRGLFCPSAEFYSAVSSNQSADSVQSGSSTFPTTQHCPKCSLGALYPKGNVHVCTYCESEI